jgi:hypothetical protein
MRAIVAFVAVVAGAGLLIRGIVAPALGFFAAAVTLAAWRFAPTPLAKIEATLAAALVLAGATSGHPGEGAGAAAIVFGLIELMRIF